ncbi:MAG: phytanoyl-CoA dioxygenase family protein [Mycobacteriales bacterium]|nr:phytanoyl-CoA dioxygenase family protein [Mycobacteriales bacterium]
MTLAPARRSDLDPQLLSLASRDTAKAGSLTFLVADQALTYTVRNGEVLETTETSGDTAVRLTAAAWADLTGQVRSLINLHLAQEITYERGSFTQLAAWDRTLRYLHSGVPPYTGSDLGGRDPHAEMSLSDSDAELSAQLTTMGYLLVKGVFTAEEMAAANAEVDRLAALARPGDEQSWFVETETGPQVCRLVYATLRSTVLQQLEQDPRLQRLGTLLDPALQIAPDRMEGSAVLIKVPGETRGLSNIPWHQDCGMGGHAVICPAVSLGIQLTGSSAETGNLLAVPGSQGQTLHYQWSTQSDLPVVEINTEPGDVTVHIQDVMHASPAPTGRGGRRTMYVTHYPATLWDHIGPGQAFNDLVRNRTAEVASLA